MGQERTESATPRRREKAREKGQISKSPDFNSALILTASFGIFFVLSAYMFDVLKYMIAQTLSNLNPRLITPENLEGILIPYLQVLMKTVLPFLLSVFVISIAVVRWQVGAIFSVESITPKFDKLSPMKFMENFKNNFNLFSPKKIVELVKSLLKILIVGFIGYFVLISRKEELFALLGVPIQTAFATIGSILSQMTTDICIALIVIGFLDRKYQDYEYEKSIKMTKQEIKDERKDIDGNPEIKSKIKSVQMQFLKQKVINAVPKADVVVTNPTHFAVAIRYNTQIAPAPQVIAKGADFMALKIKEIAKNNNIPIIENKPLARTLYKVVPLDHIIPSELYVAVAEVLAFVYNEKNRGRNS